VRVISGAVWCQIQYATGINETARSPPAATTPPVTRPTSCCWPRT